MKAKQPGPKTPAEKKLESKRGSGPKTSQEKRLEKQRGVDPKRGD